MMKNTNYLTFGRVVSGLHVDQPKLFVNDNFACRVKRTKIKQWDLLIQIMFKQTNDDKFNAK